MFKDEGGDGKLRGRIKRIVAVLCLIVGLLLAAGAVSWFYAGGRYRIGQAILSRMQGEQVLALGCGLSLDKPNASEIWLVDSNGRILVDGSVTALAARSHFLVGTFVPGVRTKGTMSTVSYFVADTRTEPIKVRVMATDEFAALQDREPLLRNIRLMAVEAVLERRRPLLTP